MRIALLVCLALLSGCAAKQPQECPTPLPPVRLPYEVKVPVYIDRKAPAELIRPYKPLDIPKFIAPASPDAVVGLDKKGLDELKIILRTVKTRDDAWRSWATKPTEKSK